MPVCDQLQEACVGVCFRGNLLAGTPIVGDLVVVPLGKDRHVGIEGAYALVKEIVLIVAAKLFRVSAGLDFSSVTIFFLT